MSQLSYAAAGVSIDAGDELVERIKPAAKRTLIPGVLGSIGGFGALFEVSRDYRNPVLKPYIEKYLKGVASVQTEDRMRLVRLIENMTMGTAAVGYLPESMHGAGSPQAQRIMIARQSNLEMKKELAKKIARIK